MSTSLAERVANRVERLRQISWPAGQGPTLREMIMTSIEVVTFDPVLYKRFTIKRIDHAWQPFYIGGKVSTEGFVVCKDGGNVMPGAMWFHTIENAKRGVDIYLEVGLQPYPVRAEEEVVARFWSLIHDAFPEATSRPAPQDPPPVEGLEQTVFACLAQMEDLNVEERRRVVAALQVEVAS